MFTSKLILLIFYILIFQFLAFIALVKDIYILFWVLFVRYDREISGPSKCDTNLKCAKCQKWNKKYYYIQQSQVTAYKKHIIIIIHKEENIHTRYKHKKDIITYINMLLDLPMLVACNHVTGYLLLWLKNKSRCISICLNSGRICNIHTYNEEL